jgi:N-acetylmuramoyl-L-alanine amidase
MKVLIDNGHGVDTAGKRSPDGSLREYKYAREIAEKVVSELKKRGFDAERIVTEENDISLSKRCRRVNSICDRIGTKNVILVSIHCNAAGNGSQWMNARGWEAWTSVGQTAADKLADCLYKAAEETDFKIRKDTTDGDPDKEGHLYILKHTKCPAVLTENLFQDNKEDVAFLLSEAGKETIVSLHVKGIINYLKTI